MIEPEAPIAAPVSLAEVGTILRRRWHWIAAPALAGLLAGVATGLAIKPEYRSSATLLIDAQQIPAALVAPAAPNYADERVAKIRERILSRASLAGLIAEQHLYVAERAHHSLDELVGAMRAAITVDLVSADQPGRGPNGSSIAFNLSYTYSDPQQAQTVLGRLTHMFINEDSRLRTEQAANAARFLQQRADELRDQLVTLEEKRRDTETRYAGSLPGQVGASAQNDVMLRSELSQIDSEAQGIVQQNGILAARSQEIESAAREAPDALTRAQQKVLELSSIYTDNHPDLIAARNAVENIRAARTSTRSFGGGQVQAEIAASRQQLRILGSRRASVEEALDRARMLDALQPQAAYELANIDRDYANLRAQYQQIRDKQLDAQVASNLQQAGQGERFSIVNPPDLPAAPDKPNRRQLIIEGLLAGAGLGVLLVAIWEFLGGFVNGPQAVLRATGLEPIALVPVIEFPAGAAPPTPWGRLLALLQFRRPSLGGTIP